MKLPTLITPFLIFSLTVFSLLTLPAPVIYAADNSITVSAPYYPYYWDKYTLIRQGYSHIERADDVEWSNGSAPPALIFDPNGNNEPIRERNPPFNSNGAYLNTSTGDIYVEDLFGDPNKIKVMKFDGTTLVDP